MQTPGRIPAIQTIVAIALGILLLPGSVNARMIIEKSKVEENTSTVTSTKKTTSAQQLKQSPVLQQRSTTGTVKMNNANSAITPANRTGNNRGQLSAPASRVSGTGNTSAPVSVTPAASSIQKRNSIRSSGEVPPEEPAQGLAAPVSGGFMQR